LNFDELSESRRVVVSDGLGVSEGFENRVGLKDLVLEFSNTTGSSSDVSEVLNDLLGVLSLSGSGFSRNQDRLVDVVVEHRSISSIGDGEDVGGDLASSLALVELDDFRVVDRESLVGIDHDEEKSRICIDDVALVSLSKVVKNGGFAEVAELGAIGGSIELGRVEVISVGLLDRELLAFLSSNFEYFSVIL